MTGPDVPPEPAARPDEVDLEQALPEGGTYRREPEPGEPTSVGDRAEKPDEQREGVEPEPLDGPGS